MGSEELKQAIKKKYADIAKIAEIDPSSVCCAADAIAGENPSYSQLNEDYSNLQGYSASADLKLGCGIPTEVAGIEVGNTVLDLGSGAGNDVFVARELVGDSGKVIGIDITDEMIALARKNAEISGYQNIEFRIGDIEQLPVEDRSIDVVISNCTLNLVPNKQKAFAEVYRVLKSGGHFSVSDIVTAKQLRLDLKLEAEAYAGCESGTVLKEEYLAIIRDAGFTDVEVKIDRGIEIPKYLLTKYCSESEIASLAKSGSVLRSVTVFGKKN